MSRNATTDRVRSTLRSRLVKQGRRGMSLEALTNHAQSVKRSYNASHVKAVLRSLNAEEVNDGVFAVPASR
jgi:hypothetical protein